MRHLMKNFGKAGWLALAVLSFGISGAFAMADVDVADAEVEIKRLVVGLDLSASNPLVEDDGYAARVGERIARDILGMDFQSELKIRTFGAFDERNNPFAYDGQVKATYRREQMAKDAHQLISNVPNLGRAGKLRSQNQTNIIGFMQELSYHMSCKKGQPKTTVVLVTDGIEDSEFARLINRNSKLPAPSSKIFKGCHELQILGIGRGLGSPTAVERIRSEWGAWADAAGFKNFRALNSW